MLKMTATDSKNLQNALKNVREGDETTIGPLLPSCRGEKTVLKCIREKGQKYWEVELYFLEIKVCSLVLHLTGNEMEVESV